MKTNLRNRKLIVAILTLAAFTALCSSAFAADAKAQACQQQDALWKYMQSSGDFWDGIMKQIGGTPNQSTGWNKPGTVTKPNQNVGNTGNIGNVGNTGNTGNTGSVGNSGNVGNTGSTTPGTNSSYAEQVLQLVNKERAAQGLSNLKLSSAVSAAAQVRAAECAKSFSHTRPNGSSCFTALKEAGISYRRAGENLAYGQRTPAEVVRAWMNSSGHRANILNANYTTLGVGYTVINGTPYWSQFFIQ